MTIQDIIKDNDNTNVIVERASADQCDPMVDRVYEGNLHEIPANLQTEEVQTTGWSMSADMPVIII